MLRMLIATALVASFAVGPDSGLKVGEPVSAFHPQHVFGAHKGTDACPPWTYGSLPQIQVWINNDDPSNVETLVKTLDKAMGEHKEKKLKAFIIFVTDEGKASEARLAAYGEKAGAKDIMLAYLGSKHEAVTAYKVNVSPDVKNTIMVYRKKRVTATFVNFKADEKGLAELKTALTQVTAN